MSLESPMINDEFMKKEGIATAIACRALLDKKLSSDGIDRIIDVFQSFC